MGLGLVAFILYLYFFVGFNGLFTLLSNLNMFQYATFFGLALTAVFAAILFDSLVWHSLLNSLSVKVKFRKTLVYNWIGNFVELIVPGATIGGEVARIALIQKETKHDLGVAAGTVLGSRVIGTFVYLGGLIFGFTTLLLTNRLPIYLLPPIILVLAATSSLIGIIFLVAFRDSADKEIISASMWIARRVTKDAAKLESIQQKVSHTLASFGKVFKTFKAHPRCLIKPIIFGVFSWFFSVMVYFMIFYALNYTALSLVDLASVYCIITAVETLTAGFPIGAVEVTMTSMFSLYGVPLAVAGVATTLTRLLTFWCQIIVGYPLIEWVGAKSLLKGGLQNSVVVKPPNVLNEGSL